jgi:hypothetical protein
MNIKIEDPSSLKLSKKTLLTIENILKTIPREHLRGLDRLQIVESISTPRSKLIAKAVELPGLYHPKTGTQNAWIEIALNSILQNRKPLYRRLLPLLTFKGNLAAVIFSLIGQHYYLTLRHSTKKNQLEVSVRSYTEKYLRIWNEQQHSLRSRLFKPLQPSFERWGRILQKKAAAEKRRKQSNA